MSDSTRADQLMYEIHQLEKKLKTCREETAKEIFSLGLKVKRRDKVVYWRISGGIGGRMGYFKLIDTKTLDNGRTLEPTSRFEKILRCYLPYKEIGWIDIGEVFFRYTLAKTPWFNIYLHQLDAPEWHPVGCHDHPWSFLTILLKGGYLEYDGKALKRRRAGSILYRPAEYHHDVTTPYGRSWSLVITGAKKRNWGFLSCEA